MGKKKISDDKIIESINSLERERKNYWVQRFGPDAKPFLEFQREEIQQKVADKFSLEMSEGGFRNRLKQLWKDGILHKFRMEERTVYYSIKKPTGR